MCEFLSFKVSRKGDIFVGNFCSHEGVFTGKTSYQNCREAEWTGNGAKTLRVRCTGTDQLEGEGEDWWRAQVLGQYKTREAFLEAFPLGKVEGDMAYTKGQLYTKLLINKFMIGRRHITVVLYASDNEFQDIRRVDFVRKDSNRYRPTEVGADWCRGEANRYIFDHKIFTGLYRDYKYADLSVKTHEAFSQSDLVCKNGRLSFKPKK